MQMMKKINIVSYSECSSLLDSLDGDSKSDRTYSAISTACVLVAAFPSAAFCLLAGYLCFPVLSLRTLSENHLSIAVSGLKLLTDGLSSPIQSRLSSVSRLRRFLQSDLTRFMCENILSTLEFVNGITRRISIRLKDVFTLCSDGVVRQNTFPNYQICTLLLL